MTTHRLRVLSADTLHGHCGHPMTRKVSGIDDRIYEIVEVG
jgi:hypothetical protein